MVVKVAQEEARGRQVSAGYRERAPDRAAENSES
jgi:hypothetical protein